jgi:hypothetical protein
VAQFVCHFKKFAILKENQFLLLDDFFQRPEKDKEAMKKDLQKMHQVEMYKTVAISSEYALGHIGGLHCTKSQRLK